ncbi:MAG TPA: GAF and ANTAR domain-containing protein [Acidimicrobiales bacterium]|nr:GAF and ANTAR domain-containing protein [Acidimicrobiales bacterium]
MTVAERFLAAVIDRSGDRAPTLELICQVCCDLLPITVASVVLMGTEGVEGITGASDPLAAAIQNEEFTLGEGPATEVRRQRGPVLVSDLGDALSDWPQFVPAVARLGVGAIYAIPLRIGAVDLGVLVLGGARPRALAGQELADSFLIGDLVSRLVLDLQAGVTSESLAWALDATDSRTVVHQATGMIAAQLNVGVAEALVALRANAFATDRPIDQVATEVVAGRRRFEEL